MNCRDFEEALAGALSGDPAPEEAASHLRQCRACQTRARQMLRLHESLFRNLEPFPASLHEDMKAVVGRMDQDLQSPDAAVVDGARERIERLPRIPRRPVRRSALVAAGLLLAAASGGAFLLLRSSTDRGGSDRAASPKESEASRIAARERARKEEELRRAEAEALARVSEERARLDRIRHELLEAAKLAEQKNVGEAERRKQEEARRKLEDELARLEALEKAREKEKEAKTAPDRAPDRKIPAGVTVVKVGQLEQMKGTVYVVPSPSAEKIKAHEGRDLVSGESVVTDGPNSRALISGDDSLKLELGGDATLAFGAAANDASLARGSLSIDVSKSAKETAMSLSTAHARIQMARGHYYLHARADSTYFETRLGSAHFTNLATRNSLQVPVGHFAVSPAFPGIDQHRIDQAIRDGIEYLRKADSPPCPPATMANSDPLILLTFLHAGVPESDPRFQQLLKDLLKNPIERTYVAALQAMILEELDRVKYQSRIVDCARFLVDNQCRNGEWSYGTPTSGVGGPFVDPRPDVATVEKLDSSGRRVKPKIVKKVAVQKMREGPAQGDNSNAQYAALGLRACFDAGVLVPAETVQLASRWWRESQFADREDRKTPYGEKGWCYHDGKGKVNGSDCCKYTYAGMTAGAVGSLVIYDFMLGREWKSDPNIRSGLEWLTFNFSVTRNLKWGKEIPGDPEDQGAHFYYLYALERLGTFTGQEKMGKHEWYSEGAAVILERQRPDGSWMDVPLGNSPVWDTCFSILFLRRATRPLGDVPSVDRFKR